MFLVGFAVGLVIIVLVPLIAVGIALVVSIFHARPLTRRADNEVSRHGLRAQSAHCNNHGAAKTTLSAVPADFRAYNLRLSADMLSRHLSRRGSTDIDARITILLEQIEHDARALRKDLASYSAPGHQNYSGNVIPLRRR